MPSPSPLVRQKLPRLILASASPRRRELLAAAGIPFDLLPTSVEERRKRGESPREFVARLAYEKADAARAATFQLRNRPHPIPLMPILGADTVVVAAGKTLGKPASLADARRMLRLLSGRRHVVLTGLCLLVPSITRPRKSSSHSGLPERGRKVNWKKFLRISCTTVKFRRLSAAEIAGYVSSGEPMDKAGAYAIQGRASKFVEWIDGCYFNVVGLPVSLLYEMLLRAQYRPAKRTARRN
jgi:septum formation protein